MKAHHKEDLLVLLHCVEDLLNKFGVELLQWSQL